MALILHSGSPSEIFMFYDIRDFHFPDECSRNLSLCHFLLFSLSFLFEVLCSEKSTLVA